jgi:hypothetical protein
LRDYIDRLRSERSRIIRERIILDNNYNESEQSAPFLAPNWTKSGYNGKLKDAVVQACQPGRTSTADTTAEERTSAVPDQPDNSTSAVPDQPDNSTSAVPDQPDNSTAVPDQPDNSTSAVPDQPDNSAGGTSSNVPASQDSDALVSLRLYGDDYDADEEGGEEEEETVLLTSQRDDQDAS